jgi:cytochrome c-type biogenesis protein CcmH/NrfG
MLHADADNPESGLNAGSEDQEEGGADDSDEQPARLAAILENAVAKRPSSFESWMQLASVERDREHYSAALQAVDRALSLRADDRARYLRLQLLVAQGGGEEAWQEARALIVSPFAVSEPEVWTQAAQAASQAREKKEAVRLLQIYLEKIPESPVQWALLGTLADDVGDAALAAAARRNAQVSERNLVLKLHQRARRYLRVGQRDQAILDLRSCLIFDPHYEPARTELRQLGAL